MNTDKLTEIVDDIIHSESQTATQNRLKKLAAALANLANQPQSPDHQKEVSENLILFRKAIADFENYFTPQDYERVLELAPDVFSKDIGEQISKVISENAMTPTVANDFTQAAVQKRAETFKMLSEFSGHLDFFNFGYAEPPEGTTEVGFQIPREIFDNNYNGFLSELKEIQRMIRFFSETATGESQTIQVGSISTTDPLIFLAMSKEIALMFSASVTWGIGVWFTVEKIRKVRAETAQIEAFTAKEVDDIFGKKIKDTITLEVEKKVNALLAEGKAPKARNGELKAHLTWALNSLLAKMERGFTIELRIEPPKEPESEEDPIDEAEAVVFEQLSAIQDQLVFPEPSDDPVLSIPKLDDDK